MVIYLDNSSTTYPKPQEVYLAMDQALKKYVNPSRGTYPLAIESIEALYEARESIAKFFHIEHSERVIFTYNCTYGINIALNCITFKTPHKIAICPMSHNAVIRPAMFHARLNQYELPILRYNPVTTVDLHDLHDLLKNDEKIKVVVINHASNVTGQISPLKQISEIVHKFNRILMVDAAQSAGNIDIDVEKDNIDVLCFSGHKSLYGPQGIGCLYIKEGVHLTQFLAGGTGSYSDIPFMPEEFPDFLEPGTVNLQGAIGLAAGISYIQCINHEEKQNLIDQTIKGLLNIQGIVMPSHLLKRVPVISFTHEKIDCQTIAEKLAYDFDIATRFGLHCAPVAHKSIGTYPNGTVRVSLGIFNTYHDINNLLEAVSSIVSQEIHVAHRLGSKD